MVEERGKTGGLVQQVEVQVQVQQEGCKSSLQQQILVGSLYQARVVLQLVRLGDLFEQVVQQVAVDEATHGVVPGPEHVGRAGRVVLRGPVVLWIVFLRIAAQHASGDVLQQAARGRGKGLSRPYGALVVALRELGFGQLPDQHAHLVLPEGQRQLLDARQTQSKLVQHALQQRGRRLHAVLLRKGEAIVVDGVRVLESLDLGVQLVVDQHVEEGVCLGGGER